MKYKTLARTVFSSGAIKALVMFGALALQWFMSKNMNIKDVGIFFSIITLLTGLSVLVRFGADQVILKYGGIEFYNGKTERYTSVFVSSKLKILIRASLAAIAIAMLAFYMSEGSDYIKYAAVSVLIIPFSLLVPYAAWMRARGMVHFAAFWEPGGVSFISLMIFGVLFLVFDRISLLLSVFCFGACVTFMALPAFFARSKESFKYPTQVSTDYGITQIFQFSLQWGVAFYISMLDESESLALITACLRIAMGVSFVLIIVNGVLGPRFSHLFHAGDILALKKLAKSATQIMMIVALPVFLLVVLCGERILLYFGADYTPAYNALVVISFAQLFNVCCGSAMLLLNMTNFQRSVRDITIFTGLIVIALAPYVFGRFGLNGAAYLIAMGIMANNSAALYFLKRKLGFTTLPIAAK